VRPQYVAVLKLYKLVIMFIHRILNKPNASFLTTLDF
jgi:hypothetical protein